jgi:hypothetical protein
MTNSRHQFKRFFDSFIQRKWSIASMISITLSYMIWACLKIYYSNFLLLLLPPDVAKWIIIKSVQSKILYHNNKWLFYIKYILLQLSYTDFYSILRQPTMNRYNLNFGPLTYWYQPQFILLLHFHLTIFLSYFIYIYIKICHILIIILIWIYYFNYI